jgi:hypothetical protein
MIAVDWDNAVTILKPLAIYIVGIVLYSLFVFKFYKFLSKKDIFPLNLEKYNTSDHPYIKKFFSVIFYFIEYVLFFPVLVFFWFGVLAGLLVLMSRGQALPNILMVAIAIVGAVRATAYYNEELSKDLAKMLPFAMLGIFLIDITYFKFSESVATLKQATSLYETFLYYLLFVVALEFVLRLSHWFLYAFIVKGKEDYE